MRQKISNILSADRPQKWLQKSASKQFWLVTVKVDSHRCKENIAATTALWGRVLKKLIYFGLQYCILKISMVLIQRNYVPVPRLPHNKLLG